MKFRAMLIVLIAVSASAAQRATATLLDVQNVVIIYQENWSFDSLYGSFPGANGIANAKDAIKQEDKTGKSYTTLPQPVNTLLQPPGPDPRIPAGLPMAPFDLAKYFKPDEITGNL